MSRRLPATAALLLSACSAAALDGQAILRPTCAPNDAAAVQLVVSASSGEFPQLRVTVWRSEVEGTTVTVPGSGGDAGNALWCTANERCQELAAATVAFGRKRADASVDVTVDARAPRRVAVQEGAAGAVAGIARPLRMSRASTPDQETG